MYNAILAIANDIIVIGGALMMILGIILIIILIVIALRCNSLVGKASGVVELVTQYVTLPFTYLAGLFSRDSSEKEETKATPRTRTRRKN